MKWRRSLLFLIVLSLVITASGCGAPAPEPKKATPAPAPAPAPKPEGPRRGGTLVIGMGEEPNTLDPHKTGAAASNWILTRMSDGLLERDPKTGDYIPNLAKKYEVSSDGLTVTFYLRDDIKFHSGGKFTAKDIKATWERAKDPKTKTVMTAGQIGPIKEMTVLDDYTLKVTYEKPFGPLFYGLSQLCGYTHAIDPAHLAKYGEDGYGRNPSSTGPWKFGEWVTGQSITLLRNEDYKWAPAYYTNRGPAYPDKIIVRYIMEDATRAAALEAGEIHIASIPSTEVERFKKNANFNVHSYPASGVSLSVWFNVSKPPMNDVKLRQALAYAVDKNAIIQGAVNGHAVPAHGPLPPTIWGYSKDIEKISYNYNLDKARALLDEAGWKLPAGEKVRKKGNETLKITLFIMPNDAWKRASEMIQASWRSIGVDVEIQSYEWGTLMQYLNEGRHHANLMGYGYGDPDILYMVFHSSQAGTGLNWSHIKNDAELDAAVMGQRNTIIAEERLKHSATAQRIVVERAYWAPIYILQVYVATHKRVQDFKLNWAGGWLLHDVWLKD